MPELPEVETTRAGIEPHIRFKNLVAVTVRNRSLRWPVEVADLEGLCGRRLISVRRRSKYLLFDFEGVERVLLMHLGMSGSMTIADSSRAIQKHDHIDLSFGSDTILRFNDPRRFGCCLLVSQDDRLLANLGPEPLSNDFSGETLFKRSRGRKQAVKNFIMDAKVVVGVGNIYASESLFKAGIRPSMVAGRVSRKRYSLLAESIRSVLTEAIKAGGTTLNDFLQVDGKPGYFRHELQVYGRRGEPCFKCAVPVKSQVIGQRSSFYCPSCQRF